MADPSATGELVAATNVLSEKVDGLSDRTAHLADAIERQERRLGVFGRRGALLAAVVVLALLVVAAAGYIGFGQVTTNETLARVVDQQEAQRAEVMCPLLALVVGGYNPTTRPEGPAREQYERGFSVMRDIYSRVLTCDDPLIPPAQR